MNKTILADWIYYDTTNARNIHSHVIEHDMEALRVFASPTNKIANAIILHHPKGIYRRNIGDYLLQPYLWVKYNIGDHLRQPFLWSIMSEFTIIYCYKRYSSHNRQ